MSPIGFVVGRQGSGKTNLATLNAVQAAILTIDPRTARP